MCGIVGIFDTVGEQPVERRALIAMANALRHRGPDGEGYFVAPGIGLGHRRLAIIDLATGQQPMSSDDGHLTVVFNGEIYNFRDLAAELAMAGCAIRTSSDTEIILHAWRIWGEASVERLHGMFAFALWDARSNTLVLARDRIGKKPIYIHVDAVGRLTFASELKALRAIGAFRPLIDHRAVEDFLALGYVPDPRTIYVGVEKLPPANMIIWRRGSPPIRRQYWEVRLDEQTGVDVDTARTEAERRLAAAVSARLISDVPLGAFLSGGVDSSAVVATMARQLAAPVKTFTIGFGVAAYDETAFARKVAERYHTEHTESYVDPMELADPLAIDRVVDVYDEPFGDSSALPTLRVCAEARKQVTVALSGDGGDEAFAGYRRYLWQTREHVVRRLLPAAVRGPLFSALAAWYPEFPNGPRYLRARSTFRELASDAVGAFFNSVAAIGDHVRGRLYTAAFKRELQGYHASETLRHWMKRCPDERPLLQAQYADLKTWLPGRMLVKVDRASMANSLEVRNPFLDHRFFEWALTLPSALKMRGTNQKAILKRAMEPLVPHDVLYRPKQGFTLPLSEWLRREWRCVLVDSLAAPAMADARIIEPGVAAALVDEHLREVRDHGPLLWNLLVLARFLARGSS